jgi:chaperonin GroES
MSVPISPIADYVLVEQEKKEPETKTASGFFIAGATATDNKVAVVLAIGKDIKQVKVGDKIIYKGYSTTEVTLQYGGSKYLLVKEEDILATVK